MAYRYTPTKKRKSWQSGNTKMLFKYSLCVIGLFSNAAFRENLPYLEPKLSFLFLPGRLGSDGI